MNRKITLFIILGLVLLLIPLFAAAEDDFKVTFSSTNVKPKETITATINNLNPGNTIVEVKWSEKQYGFSGSLTSVTTLKIDSQTNTVTIKTRYGHEGWLEIHYKNQNGQTMVYTSDSVTINNIPSGRMRWRRKRNKSVFCNESSYDAERNAHKSFFTQANVTAVGINMDTSL